MDTPEIPTLPRPKKPLSAYLMYVQEMRSIVKQQQPDAKLIDIAKQIATMWENLSDDEKQIYVDRANADRQRYEQELQECYASTTK